MKAVLLTLLGISCLQNLVFAQFVSPTIAGFHSMHHSLQTTPASMPKYRLNIALPYAEAQMDNNFTLNDLFTSDGDSLQLDLSKWTEANSGPLRLQLNQNVRLLDFGFALSRKNYLYFGTSVQSSQDISLPTGLLQFAELGKRLDMSGFNLNITAFSEYHVGMVQQLGAFHLGCRFRLLNGLTHIQLVRSDLELDMSSDSILLRTDLEMRASNLQAQDPMGMPLSGKLPAISDLFPLTENRGISMDFGLGYTFGDKLSLDASFLNIGNSITWKSNLSTYTSKGQFHYTGPLIDLGVDSQGNAFQGIADTITAQIKANLSPDTMGSGMPFTTSMTQQMLVQLKYRPYKFLGVGFIYRLPLNEAPLNRDAAIFMPYLDLQLNNLLSTRIHYRNSEYRKSLGGLVALRLWGLQLCAGVEGIDFLYKQSTTRFFQLQGGLTFCFGDRKKSKKVQRPATHRTEKAERL
jgi:hypothetical protein